MQDNDLYEPTRRATALPPRGDDAWEQSPDGEPEAIYEPGEYLDERYDADDDYENEALDSAHRFRIAMGVFDTVGVLVGVMVVLVLVALLVSLYAWLRTDVTHTFALLQTRLR